MRRCKLLRRLRKTLNRRISRLEQRLKSISVSGANQDREVVVAYLAIEALNAWAMFSRSFYLSCVLGAKTERKKQVTFTMAISDPLGAAITCCNRWAVLTASGVWHRRDEPAWHDPTVLMRVCGNLGCSIQVQIGEAFSINQNVFKDLPVFRNFFAHRNEQTSQAARNIAPRYTLPSSLSPSEILLAVSPRASNSVMLEWLTEINITAEFLCKG